MDNEPLVQDLRLFQNPPGFRGRSTIVVQLWWIVQATLFACSPQFMYGWRAALLRLFGAQIGTGTIIRPTVRITYPWKLKVGDYSWVGDYAELYNLAEIEIGNNAVVSQYAYLCTGSHDPAARAFDIFGKPILVEDEAWIATGAFVHPGVNIGRGSVVAARAMVTKDTKPYFIHVGAPAKPTRDRRLSAS